MGHLGYLYLTADSTMTAELLAQAQAGAVDEGAQGALLVVLPAERFK
jgi:hypothetical protein